MTLEEIPKIRLTGQQISAQKYKTVKEIVSYMGALQAQDYAMAKWAIGLRLKNVDEQFINSAIERGDILRTHLLRPTWHFVSSDDIYWLLELTASKIKKSMSSRNKELGLSHDVFKKSNKIIENALSGNLHLTREELIVLLNKANIRTDQNRASHILAEAELSGIICSGVPKNNKSTYALLEERVNKKNKGTGKELASARLAELYFTSRGPATVRDFAWWSGLTLTLSRTAIGLIKNELNSFTLGSETYWFSNSSEINENSREHLYLLPAFDEYLIGYTDRSLVLVSEKQRRIVTTNGVFHAIIVFDGKVRGTWKRTIIKDGVLLEFSCFNPPDKKIKQLIEKEAFAFNVFLGKKIKGLLYL